MNALVSCFNAHQQIWFDMDLKECPLCRMSQNYCKLAEELDVCKPKEFMVIINLGGVIKETAEKIRERVYKDITENEWKSDKVKSFSAELRDGNIDPDNY